MKVRDYTDKDFDPVNIFVEKLLGGSERVTERVRFEIETIRNMRDGIILVYEEGGEVKGVVTGHDLSSYMKERGLTKVARVGDYYLREIIAPEPEVAEVLLEGLLRRIVHGQLGSEVFRQRSLMNYTKLFASKESGERELLESYGFESTDFPAGFVMDLGEFVSYPVER